MEYEIELLGEKTGYDGFFELKRFRLRHSLYAGGWSAEIERERVERLQAAAVLLYDPERDQVVMIEQFRIGALERGRDAWLLEIIGGLVEPGENAAEVARRESLEEAGCALLELVPICDFYVSPGTATERVYLYCGRVDAGRAGGIFGIAEEGEDIRVEVLSADQAIGELYGGRVNSTTAIIAVQWLAMHRESLRRRWRKE